MSDDVRWPRMPHWADLTQEDRETLKRACEMNMHGEECALGDVELFYKSIYVALKQRLRFDR